MLRKIIVAIALSSGLLLSACATNPNGSINIPVLSPSDPRIAQIQANAATVCSFVPTVQTVASIIATFAGASGVVDVVGSAVRGICSAITAKGARRGGPPPRYRGVVIQGRRV